MSNYGPNDRDPRDGPQKGETLEGKVARETAEGAEEQEENAKRTSESDRSRGMNKGSR